MFKPFATATLAGCLLLSACAEKSENVQAAQVSTIGYDRLTCRQIAEEATLVSQRAQAVSGEQNEAAKNDAVATGVALVVFWPAAFFIKGNKAQAAELARLKGELNALEQVSVRKNCGITFQKAPVAKSE